MWYVNAVNRMPSRVRTSLSFIRCCLRGVVLVALTSSALATAVVSAWTYFPSSRAFFANSPRFNFQHTPDSLSVMGCLDAERNTCMHLYSANAGHFHHLVMSISYRGAAAPTVGERHADWRRGSYSITFDSGRPVSCSGPSLDATEEEKAHFNRPRVRICVGAPAWLPAPLFAAYPIWAFVRGPWRRRRRKAKGLCIRCGYDLTGNVTGVCSECGTKAKPQ